jgi:Lrp/AsnC family transcriptional regulator for asnA, asnC and gidA
MMGPTMQKTRDTRIDDIDRQIIAVLQVDGRTAYSAIARQVGLSEPAVRSRVHRLRDSGIMQVVAVTDPLQLGFSREAMVAIKVTQDPHVVADALAELDEVDFIVLVTGSFDILLEVVAESDEAFLAMIQRIRATVGEGTVRVHPYLKTVKQDYAWGAGSADISSARPEVFETPTF